ncbi:MAG: terminase, partial [Alphaproteobacteria bacterium]
LLLGLAIEAHRHSLIMRREYVSLAGLTDRAVMMLGRKAVRQAPPPRAETPDGRLIEFGAAQHPGDEEKFQGRARDFLGFDEATQFGESQVRFLMGWVRTAIEGQRARVVLSTNPPLDARGEWVIPYFAPWLDPAYPKPAEAGELRWFVTAPDGRDMEVEDSAPIELAGQTYRPQSRTFIPAALADNPYLVRTGYQGQLDALPEPLRSAIRDGDFFASRQDDEWQILPPSWVRQATDRWRPEPPAGVPMCAIGVDVARGGKDETVLAIRHDAWFAPVVIKPGVETPLGTDVAGMVV